MKPKVDNYNLKLKIWEWIEIGKDKLAMICIQNQFKKQSIQTIKSSENAMYHRS